MRIKAVIAYDGTKFYGFQSQTTTNRTVVGKFQETFDKLGIDSPITGSGRTDRGVHASNQVIHCDLPGHWQRDLPKFQVMANRHLYPYIRIKHLYAVTPDFHARFDARRRIYRYCLKTAPLAPFETDYLLYLPQADPARLQKALQRFVGEHDFVYFHKSGSDPKSTRRTIHAAKVLVRGNKINLYLEADGFLRAQVRMIVAAVLQMHAGTLDQRQINDQLAGKVRHTSRLAPPHALYLARVIY